LPLVREFESQESFVDASLQSMIPLVAKSILSEESVDEMIADGTLDTSALANDAVVSASLKTFYNFAYANTTIDEDESSFLYDMFTSMLESISNYLVDAVLDTFGFDFSEEAQELLSSSTPPSNNETTPNQTPDNTSSNTTQTTNPVDILHPDSDKTTDPTPEATSVAKVVDSTILHRPEDNKVSFNIEIEGEYSYWAYKIDAGEIKTVLGISFATADTSNLESGNHSIAFLLYDNFGNLINELPASADFFIDQIGPRDDHAPQEGTGAKEITDKLLSNAGASDLTDAKYFVRQLKKSALKTYTTNGSKNTVQEEQMSLVSKNIFPVAAKMMGTTKGLIDESMRVALDFSDDVNSDLKQSVSDMSSRLESIANTLGYVINPDNIQDQNDAYVSKKTTSFGDEVGFAAYNVDIDICIFFCSSSGTADVAMWVSNSGSDGNSADIELKSAVKATGMSIEEMDFRRVESSDSSNSFNGNGYTLNMDSFSFVRTSMYDAELKMTMSGEIFGQDNPNTKAHIESLILTVQLEQTSASYDFKLISSKVEIDGEIDGKSGANFDGKMFLDGSSKNNLEGVITKDEIKMDGSMQVDISVDEIRNWLTVNNHTIDINDQNGRNFNMDATVTKGSQSMKADMLMLRNTSKDTWSYTLTNIALENGDELITAKKLYLVESGDNRFSTEINDALNGAYANVESGDDFFGISWSSFDTLQNVDLDTLNLQAKDALGNLIKLGLNLDISKSDTAVDMNFDASYQYIDTLITAKADIDTSVTSSDTSTIFSTDFTLEGKVKNPLVPEMRYNIQESQTDATHKVRYLYFEQGDERYQMGYKMDITEGEEVTLTGADSYGVLCDIVMDKDAQDIQTLTLKNRAEERLGSFDSEQDASNINFNDGSSDYLYFNGAL
jgi:hypothetical protein